LDHGELHKMYPSSNQGELMDVSCNTHRDDEKCIQNVCLKTLRKAHLKDLDADERLL